MKVTDWPNAEGFADETSDVEVGADEMVAEAGAESGLSPDALIALTT